MATNVRDKARQTGQAQLTRNTADDGWARMIVLALRGPHLPKQLREDKMNPPIRTESEQPR